MWRSRWRCVIKPACSVCFLLSINIFVWQNVLYFPNDRRTLITSVPVSCILRVLNDKDSFIGERYTVSMICCFAALVFMVWLRKSKEILFLRLWTALCGAVCRLTRWHHHSLENLNYITSVVLLCNNEHWPSGTVFILNCSTLLCWCERERETVTLHTSTELAN